MSVHAAVLVGGAIGALARAGLGELSPAPAGQWPWATLAANLAGTALLALLTALLVTRGRAGRHALAFWGAGVCGALTTFSTLQVEAIDLARHGRPAVAVAYVATSVTLGVAVAIVASGIVRRGSR